MPYLSYTPLLIVALYFFWQLRNFYFWQQTTVNSSLSVIPADYRPLVAILIPARNEAQNLPLLLHDLSQLDYPAERLQVIVIDDHSSDETAHLARQFQGVKVLQLADFINSENQIVAHKKAALTLGIQQTDAELIVTTDADCRWPAASLQALLHKYQPGQFRSGPVLISPVNNLCSYFQALDLMAYMFLTAAYAARNRPILANGANLAIDRQLFLDIDGYQGVDHLPSGDDVLLLHKLVQFNQAKQIRFINDPAAIVSTTPVQSWSAFWQQRLRWASKSGDYQSIDLQLAQGLTFITCLSIVAGLLISLCWPVFFLPALTAWGIKIAIDGFVLWRVSSYYQQHLHFRRYPSVALLYPWYLVAVGTAALLGFKASWKGR